MTKAKLILTLAFVAMCSVIKSQIYFKNNYSEPVWVCLGYLSDSKEYKGWVTKGWFKIEPGENKSILSYNPMGRYIYYYAQTEGAAKKFEGKNSLLTHPKDAFNIKNADKDYVKKDNPKYQWMKFREIDKGMKDMVKLKYTINFQY